MYIKRFVLWGFWFLIFYEQGMYDCTCAVMYNIGSFGAGYVLYMHFHLVSVELGICTCMVRIVFIMFRYFAYMSAKGSTSPSW